MDAVSFFDVILPSVGLRCLALPTSKGAFFHAWGADNAWLDRAGKYADIKRQTNVFFAVASFKDTSSRKQTNVEAVRSFWADIDCGPGKPYPNAKEGAKAVMLFCMKLDLPRPYLVASGNGVHAYWPMDADMSGPVWTATAQLLKAAFKAESLNADPSRTADSASVLRPPGTHHRKGEPKLVKVQLVGEVTDLAGFQAKLLPYASLVPLAGDVAQDTFLPEGGPAVGMAVDNADLMAGVEQRKSSAYAIADKCGVVGLMRDTRGMVDQPTWYNVLGVLAYTVEGDEVAHEWSKGDPRYSPEEVDAKLAQQRVIGKPILCGKVGESHPTICGACTYAHVKTPWSLGMIEGTKSVITERVKTANGWALQQVVVEAPDGFKFEPMHNKTVMQHRTIRQELDEDGNQRNVEEWHTFCETKFLPITRLWIEGVAWVECEMVVRDGEKRRFLLEGGSIGKGKDTLAAELARNEIVCLNNKGPIMDSYLKAWMTRLKDTADQVVAHRHFGWDDRAFVLGQDVIMPEGDPHRAVLVGMAKSKAGALVPKGSLETWTRVIDRAYNAPGQEAYQFLVVAAFAAPLLSMLKQVNGVTVYAHTEGSGAGKTTAQKAGLSAWGSADDLMLADNKVTQNALWGLMGAYSSLPIVFDELTNQKNDIASELVFSVSSGRSKERMNASGELRENNANWCTIMLASGNTLLSEKLALHRGNAEAEISRLFEFTLSATPHLTPNEANTLFPLLRENYGHAGKAFAEYIVANYDAVSTQLTAVQAKLNTHMEITQVERHWSSLLACVTVALSICRGLDLLRFDQVPLNKWMVSRLKENRVQRDDASSDALELLGTMLADLWQGILVTEGEGDMRRGAPARVIEKPRGQLVGRAIIPLDTSRNTNEIPVLMLNTQAVRDWSNKKGVSAREIFKAAVTAGWADHNVHRFSLGKGTVEYAATSAYIAAWKLYPDKISAGSGVIVSQKLGVLQGGKSTGAGTV